MIRDVLQKKIEEYAPEDTLEQENILQEIMQHYILVIHIRHPSKPISHDLI